MPLTVLNRQWPVRFPSWLSGECALALCTVRVGALPVGFVQVCVRIAYIRLATQVIPCLLGASRVMAYAHALTRSEVIVLYF